MLRDPPVLERLHSSAQRLLTPTELQIETGVLPSLSAALLSPPVRSSRSKVKRSQSDFHSDYQAEDVSDSIVIKSSKISLVCGNEFRITNRDAVATMLDWNSNNNWKRLSKANAVDCWHYSLTCNVL